jgi:hypothetical protein
VIHSQRLYITCLQCNVYVDLKHTIFLDVTPQSLVYVHQHFLGIYCVRLETLFADCSLGTLSSSEYAVHSSKTMVNTPVHAQDCTLHGICCEDLEHTVSFLSLYKKLLTETHMQILNKSICVS